MTSLEDVFYLYERNSLIYYDCQVKNEKCKYQLISNLCYCYLEQQVLPYTIGDYCQPCSINIKCYIKPTDECPICYERILTKTNAFITQCGHHYHKKCLFNYIKIKWESSSYLSVARCPLCRTALGHPDFIKRYKSSYFSLRFEDENGLDKLEDFWLSHEYLLPRFCGNKFDHYIGLNKNCNICQSYTRHL